jgi:GT2 family glycosyltransferase
VVLYFNKIRLTRRCIQSIIEAGYQEEQIFCFDNGSQEESHLEIKKEFPNLRHLRIESNCGYSGGFNRSLEWVFDSGFSSALFLTNDTLITSNALEACLKTADETGAGMIAPCIYYLSYPEKIDSIGGFFNFEHFTLGHYHEGDMPILLDVNTDYIPGTALWIDHNSFSKLKGADETFHTYWEDVDLCFRAHQNHITLARSYASRILHGVGQTCHKKPLYTTFFFQRNRIRFCKRFLKGDLLESALEKIEKDLQALGKVWKNKGDQKRLNYLEQLLKELKGPENPD